jgi:hypothetical protein
METRYLIAFAGLVLSTPSYGDCISDAREMSAQESRASDAAMRNPGDVCRVLGEYAKFRRMEAAFYRRCYAQLNLTPLQGEQKALGPW